MLFWKKKKEITSQELIDFVNKVVVEYSRVLQINTDTVKKLSSLPFPVEVIKACIKVDAANSLSDCDYINVLSTCYTYLADFIPDELIPKGPTILSLAEKYDALKPMDMEAIMKEAQNSMPSIARGNELLSQISNEREKLIIEIESYLEIVEALKGPNPTTDALNALAQQITCIKCFMIR